MHPETVWMSKNHASLIHMPKLMWCFVDHYSDVILDYSTEVMFYQLHNCASSYMSKRNFETACRRICIIFMELFELYHSLFAKNAKLY